MLFFHFFIFVSLSRMILEHYITRFLHVHPFQYDVICLLLISVTEFTCSNSVGPLLKIWISFKSHCSHWQMIFLLFHWYQDGLIFKSRCVYILEFWLYFWKYKSRFISLLPWWCSLEQGPDLPSSYLVQKKMWLI